MVNTVRLTIKGRVQGVGYRYFATQRAMELGIKGNVRNLVNGDVEVLAEAEELILKEFIKACWKGPTFSRVDEVQVSPVHYPLNCSSFEIVR